VSTPTTPGTSTAIRSPSRATCLTEYSEPTPGGHTGQPGQKTPTSFLSSARPTVRQTAEADPNVTKYAAIDLDAAKKDLQVAESAALHHDEGAVVKSAYLAAQTARLAQLRASAKADDARVAAGQAERDEASMLLESRPKGMGRNSLWRAMRIRAVVS
jgi:hypothetical protein